MTRKHFRALAEALLAIPDPQERALSARRVAGVCAAENPRFDRARFYAACNVSSEQAASAAGAPAVWRHAS